MAFVSGVVGRVTSINLAEFGAALLAYPALPERWGRHPISRRRGPEPVGPEAVCCVADPMPFRE